jgi:hypothetical protein
MKTKDTGARWEIIVDGNPQSYDDNKYLAIEAAEYLKRKHPTLEVTLRDLEGIEATVVIAEQKPQLSR